MMSTQGEKTGSFPLVVLKMPERNTELKYVHEIEGEPTEKPSYRDGGGPGAKNLLYKSTAMFSEN